MTTLMTDVDASFLKINEQYISLKQALGYLTTFSTRNCQSARYLSRNTKARTLKN